VTLHSCVAEFSINGLQYLYFLFTFLTFSDIQYYICLLFTVNVTVYAVARMLYWSVGGDSTSARYIHRTSLDGATAADNIQQFIDVTDSSISSDDEVAAAVQDIVVDVRARRLVHSLRIFFFFLLFYCFLYFLVLLRLCYNFVLNEQLLFK